MGEAGGEEEVANGGSGVVGGTRAESVGNDRRRITKEGQFPFSRPEKWELSLFMGACESPRFGGVSQYMRLRTSLWHDRSGRATGTRKRVHRT